MNPKRLEREREKIRKEYDGRVLAKVCQLNGGDRRHGDGDHDVITYRGQQEVIPQRPLGHGLQCKIVKWMFAVGLAVMAMFVFVPELAF